MSSGPAVADLTVDTWDDVQRAMPEGVTIDEIFPTACPVQIVGDIAGQPFYFRARGSWISLGVGRDPVTRPDWHDGYQFGDLGAYAASWLTPAETVEHLTALIDQWRRRSKTCPHGDLNCRFGSGACDCAT